MWLLNSLIVLHFITAAQAAVTVYGQVPLAHAAQTSSALGSAPTPTLPAYDDTVLNPPAIPQGEDKAGTAFTLSLQQNRANMFGLSIPQRGDFFGFSIEMSVINQVRKYLCLSKDVPSLTALVSWKEFASIFDCISEVRT